MRYIPIMALLVTQAASAHTLDGDSSLVERLSHQFAGVHHLPLTLLVIAGIGLALWRLNRKRQS